MADRKKAALLAGAAAGTRKPQPDRHRNERTKTEKNVQGYKVVSVSLYRPEYNWLEQTSSVLRGVWNPKANRSLVVREAVLRLQEELEGKDPGEVLRYFTDRKAKRANRS